MNCFWGWQRTQTQSSVRTVRSLRQQMDVWFCWMQESSAERHCCVTAYPDQTNCAPSGARPGILCFSLDLDLHRGGQLGHNCDLVHPYFRVDGDSGAKRNAVFFSPLYRVIESHWGREFACPGLMGGDATIRNERLSGTQCECPWINPHFEGSTAFAFNGTRHSLFSTLDRCCASSSSLPQSASLPPESMAANRSCAGIPECAARRPVHLRAINRKRPVAKLSLL